MPILPQFSETFLNYGRELWWSLALGFILSGVVYEFIPQNIVQKYLSRKGLRPIFLSSLVGTALPVCCFGSLPIAVALRQKGARLGPVLAFLVTTPATSVSALIVCWKLLGWFFTLYIFLVVIVIGLIVGMIGNCLNVPVQRSGLPAYSAGPDGVPEKFIEGDKAQRSLGTKVRGIFIYAFVTMPREIGLELLAGIAIASFLVIFEPLQNFIRSYLTGAAGYGAVLLAGLGTYVCSTASVPMADALMKSGMNAGHAMTYLLAGPITSYGTLLVLHKEFGRTILAIYLALISILTLVAGIGFYALVSVG